MTRGVKQAIISITTFLVALIAAVFLLPTGGSAEGETAGTTVGAFTVTGGTLNTDYTYADNVLTIKSATEMTIGMATSGATTSDRIKVDSAGGANITLSGVSIDATAITVAFEITNTCTGKVTITLKGDNVLKSSVLPDLYKNGDCLLEIKGTGALNASGNANGGISGSNITISGGTITATINGSNLTISDGTVTATGAGSRAGICGSNITISGGTVNATGGEEGGAGIGGGAASSGYSCSVSYITISGGIVTATGNGGGAGIGGGYGGWGDHIEIKGGKVTATGNGGGAGIGGGYGGTDSYITISDGTVIAKSNGDGAGIGGGAGITGDEPCGGSADNITISGGTVTATSTGDGAGIGGGKDEQDVTRFITISGGVVTATSEGNGADIGNGYNPRYTAQSIYIAPNCSVKASRISITPKNNSVNNVSVYPLTIKSIPSTSTSVSVGGTSYTNWHKDEETLYAYATGATCVVKYGSTEKVYVFDSATNTFDVPDLTIKATNDSDSITLGTDYKYENGALVVMSTTPVTITGTTETERIEVLNNTNADITLDNVSIDVSSKSETAAFDVGTGNVTVTLKGTNTLKSGSDCAGLQKNGMNGSLTIQDGGNGSLTAEGSGYGAGIGSGKDSPAYYITIKSGVINATGGVEGGAGIGGGGAATEGIVGGGSNITIEGGTVTATGGENGGAGIGGGLWCDGDEIKISGGVVTATGKGSAAGIGGGYKGNCNNIKIAGGSVKAQSEKGNDYSTTAPAIGTGAKDRDNGTPATPTNDSGVSVYPITIDGIPSLISSVSVGGTLYTNWHKDEQMLYAYIPQQTDSVQVYTDYVYNYGFDDVKKCYAKIGTELSISGDKGLVTYGTDYTYINNVLVIKKDTAMTISMGDYVTETSDRIEIEKDVSANITLDGVNINLSATGNSATYTAGEAAFKIADDSTGSVTITLSGTNTLKSVYRCAGLQKNGTSGSLTIKKATSGTGSLNATGGGYAAGIGGGDYGTASNITISGGTVTATGGDYGAGIGGGDSGSGSNITISGGTVTAKGGGCAAGIGGGDSGNGSNITIESGAIIATGGENGGAGIGGGSGCAGITIKGGTVTAKGTGGGAGIGSSYSTTCTSIVITGGSVKAVGSTSSSGYSGANIGTGADTSNNGMAVYLTDTDGYDVRLIKIANPDGKTVTITVDGSNYVYSNPVNHKAVDSSDSNLYAYIPFYSNLITVCIDGSREVEYRLSGGVYKKDIAFSQKNDTSRHTVTDSGEKSYDTDISGLPSDIENASGVFDITSDDFSMLVLDSVRYESGIIYYTLRGDNLGKANQTATIKGTISSDNYIDIEVTLTVELNKSTREKPESDDFDVSVTKSETSGKLKVTITPEASEPAVQYSLNNTTWTDSFSEDIGHGTDLTVYVRYAADDDYYASDASEISVKVGHGTLTEHKYNPADCENGGNILYYTCDDCDKCFTDADGETQIDADDTVITALGHDYDKNVWVNNDASGHWHACSRCDEKVGFSLHTSMYPATPDDPEVCATCEYVIKEELGYCEQPVITIKDYESSDSVTFTGKISVTLTSETEGADIYYTTDGTDPSSANGTLYSGEFEVAETCTIKAIAVKTDKGDSPVASVKANRIFAASDFTVSLANPYFTGSQKEPTITYNGTESVVYTVKYYDKDGNKLESVPSKPGTYTVKLDLEAQGVFSETKDLNIGTFTINKATLTFNNVNGTATGVYGTKIKDLAISGLSNPTRLADNGSPEKVEGTWAFGSEYNEIIPNVGDYSTGLTVTFVPNADADCYDNTIAATVIPNITKKPVSSVTQPNPVEYTWGQSGLQSVEHSEIPSYYGTITNAEYKYSGDIDILDTSTPYYNTGEIYFTLKSNNSEDDVGNEAKVKLIYSSQNYEDISYEVTITITDKGTQNAPTTNDFEVELTPYETTYIASITTSLGNVEYSFDGETWDSIINGKADIPHATTVTGYIRYKEDDEHYASAAASISVTTGHGTLTEHTATAAKCYKEGNYQYWTCDSCNLFFSDANGNTQIKEADTVISKTSHNPSSEWSYNGTKHWHLCLNEGCGEHLDEAECSGGTATCTDKAICSTCGHGHGLIDSTNHVNKATEWSSDGTYHYHVCGDCSEQLDKTACSGGTATCTEMAICSTCEKEYGSALGHDPSTEWTSDGTKHWHVCNNTGCTEHLDEAACSGGTATCTEMPTCSTCEKEYGSSLGHNPSTEWSYNGTKHWHLCLNEGCGEHLDEAECSGGTATCTDKAICSTCGHGHGLIDSTNHVNKATEWSSDGTYHYHVCGDCSEQLDKTACSGGTATCTEMAICSTCEKEYGSALGHDPSTEWTSDGTKHWHVCNNTGCTEHLDEAACSGGTATCKDKAVCTTCEHEYGTVDTTNHVNVSTTWSSDDTSHWHVCADCDGLIGKTAHVYGADGKCECGKVKPVVTTTTTTKPETTPNSSTTTTIPEGGSTTTTTTVPEGGSTATTTTTTPATTTTATTTSPVTYPIYTGTRPNIVTTTTAAVTTTTTTTTTAVTTTTAATDTTTAPTSEPFIAGENGKIGWEVIEDQIDDSADGETITIDMNGTTKLPETILEAIMGRDITIVLEMENGFAWTINGNDVTDPSTIDMEVITGSSIKAKVVNKLTGKCEYVEITLKHDGEFGFTATLTVKLGKENKGFFANLYYYDDNGDFELISSGKIGKNGKADLEFTHASEYVIVIDDYDHMAESDVEADTEVKADEKPADVVIEVPLDDDGNPITGVTISFTAVIIAGAAALLTKKRK